MSFKKLLQFSASGSASGLSQRVQRSESVRSISVIDKLKKLSEYAEWTEENLAEEAEKLTSPEKLDNIFSHLYDTTPLVESVVLEHDAFPNGPLNRDEESMASQSSARRQSAAARLPVRLHLSKLQSRLGRTVGGFSRLVRLQYGPFHAALEVGDVIVEWNTSSLVMPQQRDVYHPVFRVGLEQHNKYWLDFVMARNTDMMKATSGDVNYGEQIDYMVDMFVEKKKLVDNLIKVIVRYNKYYSYDVFTRNCQHFVIDAMKALGVTEPTPFTGKMREYFETLRRNQTVEVFRTHETLDGYVLQSRPEMPQDELEFLLCQYMTFHIASELDNPGGWQCCQRDCQMPALEARLAKMEQARLLLNTFEGSFSNPAVGGACP